MAEIGLYCCITPERALKTTRIMASLAPGWGERASIVTGAPPDDMTAFAVWGHLWLSELIVPPALKSGRPFWFIDNGFWQAAGGTPVGHYRITFNSAAPVLLDKPDMARGAATGITMRPWRKSGRHILIAAQSPMAGTCFGVAMKEWQRWIMRRVAAHTDRPIIFREKATRRPLLDDLQDCWAVVSHSSNVAVEAAALGIPVFVEKQFSAAAPVANHSLEFLERPLMPDNREKWWASLMCQQFTLDEMKNGTAFKLLSIVRDRGCIVG